MSSKHSKGITQQWGASKHFRAKVGCYECHKAESGDKDAFMHFQKRISIIVSPKDCARCHEKEVKEFAGCHHAQAGDILGSLDNVLADVKVLKSGKLDPATWPNTAIGRINPDGSKGSCTACHSRHSFSVAQARQPENCGKCHMGPDHPQLEIYNESKHGIAFRANIDKMNLDNAKWVVGVDYNAAPSCATCHMSATPNQAVTHDVGLGVWIEKGMGLIIPAFIPSPMGDLVQYTPSLVEFFVCIGIWSFGVLLFTFVTKVVIGIQTESLRSERLERAM